MKMKTNLLKPNLCCLFLKIRKRLGQGRAFPATASTCVTIRSGCPAHAKCAPLNSAYNCCQHRTFQVLFFILGKPPAHARPSCTPPARYLSRSPSSPPPSFTQSPPPPRSLVCDVHAGLGSSSLVVHVLHYPPPPMRTAL